MRVQVRKLRPKVDGARKIKVIFGLDYAGTLMYEVL